MLTRLRVQGFKTLVDVDVPLSPGRTEQLREVERPEGAALPRPRRNSRPPSMTPPQSSRPGPLHPTNLSRAVAGTRRCRSDSCLHRCFDVADFDCEDVDSLRGQRGFVKGLRPRVKLETRRPRSSDGVQLRFRGATRPDLGGAGIRWAGAGVCWSLWVGRLAGGSTNSRAAAHGRHRCSLRRTV